MFDMFKSDKERLKDIHLAFKNKKIGSDKYSDKFQKALYYVILSKDVAKTIDKLNIDLFDYKEDCVKSGNLEEFQFVLTEIQHLSKVLSKMQTLVRERRDMKDPDVMNFSRRYNKVSIVSYDEIMGLVKDTEREECNLKDKEFIKYLTGIHLSNCKLSFHAMMLTYPAMISAGAIIE